MYMVKQTKEGHNDVGCRKCLACPKNSINALTDKWFNNQLRANTE